MTNDSINDVSFPLNLQEKNTGLQKKSNWIIIASCDFVEVFLLITIRLKSFWIWILIPHAISRDFWLRFYIVVLGVNFLPGHFIISLFYLDFYFPFLSIFCSISVQFQFNFSSISVQFLFIFLLSYRSLILDFFQFFFSDCSFS